MYSVTKMWSQKDFQQDLRGWGATDYYSVTGTVSEMLDDKGVTNANGIPALASTRSPFPREVIVVNKTAGPGLAERIVTVRYQYAPNFVEATGQNPLFEPPFIEWSMARRGETAGFDVHANAITNSARDALDNPPSVDRISLMLRITRWEKRYDPLLTKQFVDHVNDKDIIAGGIKFLKHTIKCTYLAPVEGFYAGSTSVKMGYEFEFRPTGVQVLDGSAQSKVIALEPHVLWILDVGMRSNFVGSASIETLGDLYYEDDHTRVDIPVRFDGTGKPMNPNAFKVGTGLKTPTGSAFTPRGVRTVTIRNVGTFLGYEMFGEADFRKLGL